MLGSEEEKEMKKKKKRSEGRKTLTTNGTNSQAVSRSERKKGLAGRSGDERRRKSKELNPPALYPYTFQRVAIVRWCFEQFAPYWWILYLPVRLEN
jgi:hypothetical protein